MPMPAYLTIEGKTQKDITANANTADSVGNTHQKNHIDEILVQAFEHKVSIPRDTQSGQVTGPRVHHPFKITKAFDNTSPQLHRALVDGEKLKCLLELYRDAGEGDPQLYYRVFMEEAVIVDIVSRMPNCQDTAQANFGHMEDVYISYTKIVWEHQITGTNSSDNWREPAAAVG